MMGSPTSELGRNSDETQHRVTLTKGFWMMEHEVTQGQWLRVMDYNPSYFFSCGMTCPVERVKISGFNINSIQSFIRFASDRDNVKYRLPTESEWEYAARGGENYIYSRSNDINMVAWTKNNSNNETHPVCQKQRNGYGLCDMTGNVYEYVQDYWWKYPEEAIDYINNTSCCDRISRGGSVLSPPIYARVADRYNYPPDGSFDHGFRLVTSLELP